MNLHMTHMHMYTCTSAQSPASLTVDEVCGWDSHKMAASVLVGRWGSALEVFSRTFMDTIGESTSVLKHLNLHIVIIGCNTTVYF